MSMVSRSTNEFPFLTNRIQSTVQHDLVVPPLKSIGRYELLEQLNSGGQGTVYRARDRELQRDVAIKVSHLPQSVDRLAVSRILEEGALLAQLDHPHLARVYDCGIEAGASYLVMEYVAGRSLQEEATLRPPEIGQIRLWMEELASALTAAHRAGVLHLDLKPENVMVDRAGHCKLIDFGLGRRVSRGFAGLVPMVAGTRAYMAPEQANGRVEEWTPATDVFGLGGILHFLLCQEPPPADQIQQDQRSIQRILKGKSKLRRQKAPGDLVKICQRSLSENRQERFQNAEAFRRALRSRKLAFERILALLMIIAGLLLLTAGIICLSDRNDETRTLAPTSKLFSRNGISLGLRIRTSTPDHPLVLVWTPRFGFCRVRHLKPTKVDGGWLWEPHAYHAQFCLDSPDHICCILAIDPSLSDQSLSLLATPSGPARTRTILWRGTSDSESSGIWRISDSMGNLQRYPQWARELVESLNQLNVGYTGLLAQRKHDDSRMWQVDAELQLR